MVCPVCGAPAFSASRTAPWALVRGAAYFRCARCAYIRLESGRILPPREEVERYRKHRNDGADAGYRSYLEDFIRKAVLPFTNQGARILDFGSGPAPVLAALLRECGYPVSIYDPYFSPDRSVLAGPFDLIAVHETAEHLRRPYFEFSRLSRSLAPGGCIAIRTRFAPEDPRAFGLWWYREDPTHIGFFGSRSLAAMAARLGMEVGLDDGVQIFVLRNLERPGLAQSKSPA